MIRYGRSDKKDIRYYDLLQNLGIILCFTPDLKARQQPVEHLPCAQMLACPDQDADMGQQSHLTFRQQRELSDAQLPLVHEFRDPRELTSM